MKINRLDTHDKLLELAEQADYISKGCQECVFNRPKEFKLHPFYIFAHARTVEPDERIALFQTDCFSPTRQWKTIEDVPSSRLIWIPRLNKPVAQENSMLFRWTDPDIIEIIWKLPDMRLWDDYKAGTMMHDPDVIRSIHMYKTDKAKLEAKHPQDLSDVAIARIMREIGINAKNEQARKRREEAMKRVITFGS